MADDMEREVSSTTPFFSDEVHHYQAERESEPERPKQDLFSMDDIVDLVGGAQDALNRHYTEDSAPREFTETSPEDLDTLAGSFQVKKPTPEPDLWGPEPEREVDTAIPDSTSYSFVPDISSFGGEPEAVAPKAESTKPEQEPLAAREPEPARDKDALPAAEPRRAAPTPAEAAQRPAATEAAAAPASCECLGGQESP